MTLSFSSVVFMSHNHGKLKEVSQFFSNYSLPVVSSMSLYPDLDVDETGTTFTENALLKVNAFPLSPGQLCIADDSGLEVDALNGEPGVYSARFGGEGLSDLQRCQLLLDRLQGVSHRSARFRCVIAYKGEEGLLGTVSGTIEGYVSHAISGEAGFGYDSVFIPEGYDSTFGDLGYSIKNSLSHRWRALEALKCILFRSME